MQDDTNKVDDDFEDLDFEDLDTDEDFDDESWDDFDDDESADAAGESPSPDAAPEDVASAPAKKKKSYFNLIVIAIAVLGGGGFIFSKLGGAPAPTANPAVAPTDTVDAAPAPMAEIPELAGDDLPPMPAPIENIDQDLALSDEADISLTAEDSALDTSALEDTLAADDGVLTPLPDLSAEADLQPLETLEGLDLALEDTAQDAGDDSALPALTDAETQNLALDNDAQDDIQLLPEEPVVAEELVVEDALMVAAEDAGITKIEIAEPAIDSAQQAAIDGLNAKIAEQDTALMQATTTEKELSSNLESANEEIAALKAMVESLKGEVETLKNQPVDAVETPAPAPKVVETPQEKPQPVVKAEEKPAKVPVAAPQKAEWVLRAAAPGQATLLSKDTNDLRQVEVGSTVPGLGKIQSITVENNLWVVRGTQGRVSQ